MMDLDDGLFVALTFNETNDRSANGWDNQQIQHFPAYKMYHFLIFFSFCSIFVGFLAKALHGSELSNCELCIIDPG